jgi:hypothetical protein
VAAEFETTRGSGAGVWWRHLEAGGGRRRPRMGSSEETCRAQLLSTGLPATHGGASAAVSWTGIAEDEDIGLLFRLRTVSAVKGSGGALIKLSGARWNVVEFFCESRSSALLLPWIRDCDFYGESACCVRECGGIGAAEAVRLFFEFLT